MRAVEVAEQAGPLPETEAAVIASDPTEDGREAEHEVAGKLEADGAADAGLAREATEPASREATEEQAT
jgi:hypothetical protein